MIPLKRVPKSRFEVQSFWNMEESTESYMRVLNSKPAFFSFRIQRQKLRNKEKTLSGYNLAGTLEPYSESTHYPNLVRKIITAYQLNRFDRSIGQQSFLQQAQDRQSSILFIINRAHLLDSICLLTFLVPRPVLIPDNLVNPL